MLQKCKACKNDKVKDLRGSKNLNLLKDERKKLLMRNKFLSNLLQSLGSIHKISESIGYIFRRWTRKWLAWLLFPVKARKGHGAGLWNLYWRKQASLVYGPISKLNNSTWLGLKYIIQPNLVIPKAGRSFTSPYHHSANSFRPWILFSFE